MAITVGQLLVRLGMDLSDFSKGMQDAQKELRQQGEMFKTAGETFSKAFTLPLVGLGAAATMAFAGFEQAMNKVLALGGKDVADMFGDLQKQALQLGADTKYSARQAAEAMGELAAAGFKGNEIMAAMPGLLSLAATENMKLADAARIASSVLRGFGIDASQMGDVADIMAKTAASSAVSIQDLGYSFQYIGPAARAAGQSFMDVSAALSVLGNAGIRGESAGTALRNMFNDLLTPSKAVAGALQALKISTTDVHGKLLPLGDLIKNMGPLTNNMALGFKLFGQRFSDVIPLIADGGAAFRAAQEEIKKFSGAADAMAKTMQKGIAGNLEKFTGNLETLAITIGKLLAPAVNALIGYGNRIIDWVQVLVDQFSKLPTGVQAAVLAFGAIVAAIGPVLYVLGSLAGAVGNLKLLAPALSGAGSALKLLGLDLQGVTSHIADFVRSFSSMTVGGAATSLGGFFTSFGKTLKETFAAIPSQLNSAKASLVQFGATLATTVAQNAKAAWAAIAGFTAEIVKMGVALKSVNVSKALGGITDAVGAFASSVKGKGMAGLWDDILLGFSKFSGLIGGGFTAAMGTAGTGVAALTSELVIGAAAFTGIAAAAAAAAVIITRDWDDIGRVFKGLLQDIQEDTTGLRGMLVGMWAMMAGGPFIGAIVGTWKYIGQTFKDMWDGIVMLWTTGIQTLANRAAGFAEALGFKNMAKPLREYGTEVDLLAARLKQVQTIRLPGASPEAEASVARLNALVAKYSSEVRIGKISWAEAEPQVNKVAGEIKNLYATYQRLQQDFKMGLISPEAFEKSKAAIKLAIDSASSFAASMSSSFGAAGIDVDQFGKKAKNTLSQFAKDTKEAERSADKLADILDNFPSKYDDFVKNLGSDNKQKAAFDKLAEALRDVGRAMSKETSPIILESLRKQQAAILKTQGVLENFQKVWRADDWAEGAQKIADAMKGNFGLGDFQKNLEKSFDTEVMEAFMVPLYAVHKQFEKLSAAAQFLGVTLRADDFGGASNFDKLAGQAAKAVEAYNLLAKSGQVSANTLREAWVGMERIKLAAAQEYYDVVTSRQFKFGDLVGASMKLASQQFILDLDSGLKTLKKNLAEGFTGVVESLFTFNSGKILAALKDFGQKALDGLKAALVDPFAKLFENVLGGISKGITNLIADKLSGWLVKGLEKLFGVGISTATGAAANTGLAAAGASLNSAGVALNAAAGALSAAAGASGTSGTLSGVGGAAGGLGGAGGGAGSAAASANPITAMVTAVSSAVTAIMSVMSYLLQRKMEKDIARMEVTSREVKAELMNFRSDAHVRQGQLFEMFAGLVQNIQRYGDAAGQYLSGILATLETLAANGIAVQPGTGTGTPEGPAPETPETTATNTNTAATTANTTATQSNTAVVEGNTGTTATNTTSTEGNTEATDESTNAVQATYQATEANTVATTANTTATTTATTATGSLGLAAEVAAGRLPAYAATLEDFVGKTSKELAMYVKEAGSSLEQSMALFDNGTKRLVRDLKTGLQYVVDVATDKILKIYSAQEKVVDEANGAIVNFSTVAQVTTDYTQGLGEAVSNATSEVSNFTAATENAAYRFPTALNNLATSVANAGDTITQTANEIALAGRAPVNGMPVLGSDMPSVVTATQPNVGNVDWGANSGITIGGRPIPQNFASASSLTLNVNVQNADSRQVANEMVSQWRSQGVDI